MPPALPPENLYGHSKKLAYILGVVEGRQRALGGPARVLDFGCGNGEAVSRYIVATGCDYLGVDVHAPSLAHAVARFGAANARFADAVPPTGTFDIIVYADILEHIDDPAAILREHGRRLAPGGVIVGSVPNGYGPFEMENRIDRGLRLTPLLARLSRTKRRLFGPPAPDAVVVPYNHESGHVVFFTRRSFAACVERASLRLTDFVHGAFLGASVSGILLARSPRLLAWNVRVADRLPHWAVSTWYFTLEPADGN